MIGLEFSAVCCISKLSKKQNELFVAVLLKINDCLAETDILDNIFTNECFGFNASICFNSFFVGSKFCKLINFIEQSTCE